MSPVDGCVCALLVLNISVGNTSREHEKRSGTVLGPLWDRSGTALGPFWDRSGTVLLVLDQSRNRSILKHICFSKMGKNQF